MDKNILLKNPSYKFFRKISDYIPFEWRQFLKSHNKFLPVDLVKWLLIDAQRPHYFHPYGLYFFTGLPGAGKTIFMTKKLLEYRQKYGSAILIGTNYGFALQDFEVKGYEDILKIYDKPCIIGYDEIQNDFDSRNWANIDYAFSERITQSRKMEGLMILGTAQKFGFVDRRLRQLTHAVYKCHTFFERLTLAKIFEPEVKEKIENGQYTENSSVRNKGIKMFVQTDEIRELYNSYQILQNVKERIELQKSKPQEIVENLRDLILDDMPHPPKRGVAVD
jgi:hypothetical protein